MLRTIFAVFFVAFTTSTFANNNESIGQITDTGASKQETVVAQMQMMQEALLDGLWVEQSQGEQQTNQQNVSLQFHDYGMVDVFTSTTDGQMNVDHLFYSIEETQDGIVLEFSNPPSNSNLSLSVIANSSDQLLVEVNGHPMQLRLENNVSESVQDQLERQLVGSWEMYSYPFDVITDINECGTFEEINGASLSYQFNEDGSYQRIIASDYLEITETGFYEVSADGSFLMFYAAVDHNPEQIYTTHVAKIDQLENDGLVINQALTLPYSEFDTLFCTCNKDFTLTRTTLSAAQ
ncbi:MAG: hypothetical protein AAF598_12315 [Bacteroidota bacterium]